MANRESREIGFGPTSAVSALLSNEEGGGDAAAVGVSRVSETRRERGGAWLSVKAQREGRGAGVSLLGRDLGRQGRKVRGKEGEGVGLQALA